MGRSLAITAMAGLVVVVAGCSNTPVTSSLPTPGSSTTLAAGELTDEELQAERERLDTLTVETTRSSVRPDDDILLETADGRRVSGQYLKEQTYLAQTGYMRQGGESDYAVIDAGYSFCEAFARGTPVNELLVQMMSAGWTADQAGKWVGSSVVLYPEHQVTVLRQVG